jgi:PPK2 family polyphosphate:nucleotide phosphotransferase
MELSKISTKAPKDLNEKDIRKKTEKLYKELNDLHKVMRAEEKHSILGVLQGMDASGKDGSVASLYNGLFPVATNVHSFKAPTSYESSKDYLWRIHYNVPCDGHITLFNRSHYEDILVPTVHKLCDSKNIKKRYKHINDFENMLVDNGTQILKFYLHISKEEQKERFKERFTTLEKKWKYSSNDLAESKLWEHYMDVYENIFDKCDIKWHIIPADTKWYRDYLIAKIFVEKMRSLKMKYPNKIK